MDLIFFLKIAVCDNLETNRLQSYAFHKELMQQAFAMYMLTTMLVLLSIYLALHHFYEAI